MTVRKPTCQHCLSDPRYTPVAPKGHARCPVCGAAYAGPRRDVEYGTLVAAGLVVVGE